MRESAPGQLVLVYCQNARLKFSFEPRRIGGNSNNINNGNNGGSYLISRRTLAAGQSALRADEETLAFSSAKEMSKGGNKFHCGSSSARLFFGGALP